MKKIFLTFILLIGAVNIYAQTTANTAIRTVTINRKIDKNTVVRDSAGVQYRYEDWQALQMTGDYSLRPAVPIKDGKPNEDPNMEYILVKLTPEKKAEMKARMGKPRESPFFKTNQIVKPFSVQDINGNSIDEKDWAGKTVVLNFWYVNASSCLREIPELNKLVIKYTLNPNVIFIAIAIDPSASVKDFTKKMPFGYRLVSDGRQYGQLFGINSYPTDAVIDKSGKVIFHTYGYGPVTVDYVAKAIEESEKAQ